MEMEKKILGWRISQLEEQTRKMVSAINDSVNKVLQNGKLCLDGKKKDDEGNPLDYREVSNLVENMYLLLAQQYRQLAENQIQHTITVTALVEEYKPEKESIIKEWTRLAGNTGGYFDVDTGIFTAPVEGTYAVALKMLQVNKGKIVLNIMKAPSEGDPDVCNDSIVSAALTDRGDSTSCDFTMNDMSVGDKLYVSVLDVDNSPKLCDCRFSIFLVK